MAVRNLFAGLMPSTAVSTRASERPKAGTYSFIRGLGQESLTSWVASRMRHRATPGLDTKNAAGDVAFALTIDPVTGKVYMVQYLSVENLSSAGASYDEPVSMAASALQTVNVTYTDNDGDTANSLAQHRRPDQRSRTTVTSRSTIWTRSG